MATNSEVPGEEEVDCDMCEECGKFILNREALLDNAPKAAPKTKKMTSPTPEAVLIQMVHEKMEAEKERKQQRRREKTSGATPIVMTPASSAPMLLFDGKTVRRQFQPAETLAMVREWIEKHQPRTVLDDMVIP